MKCPVCNQQCRSTWAKQLVKDYTNSTVPRHVRYWRRFKTYLWGWPPAGWTR